MLASPIALTAICRPRAKARKAPRVSKGSSAPLALPAQAPASAADKGPEQAGPEQAGPGEAGPEQAGPEQAGPEQAGPADAGSQVAGPHDAGSQAAGSQAAGSQVAGPADTGSQVAGSHDAGSQVAGSEEAGGSEIRPVRSRVARAIESVLAGIGGAEGAEAMARKIERSAYNHAVIASGISGASTEWGSRSFSTKYEHYAVYCIRNALKMSLLIESGAEKARNIASCSSQFLYPEVWSALVTEKTARDQCTDNVSRVKANTTALACGRCKSKECYFYEMQTRSADEPMTVFVTCLDCGHRWRTG